MSRAVLGLAAGIALGFAGYFGGFGAFVVVAVLGIIGFLAGFYGTATWDPATSSGVAHATSMSCDVATATADGGEPESWSPQRRACSGG